jgi:hypothetical protein
VWLDDAGRFADIGNAFESQMSAFSCQPSVRTES